METDHRPTISTTVDLSTATGSHQSTRAAAAAIAAIGFAAGTTASIRALKYSCKEVIWMLIIKPATPSSCPWLCVFANARAALCGDG
jgi:hypothetical protein